MNFDQFLQQAWSEHGDNAYAVGQQLKTACPALTQPFQVAELTRILVHVFGEHLGDWGSGQSELTRLQAHPLSQSDAQAHSAVRVAQAALSLAQGVVPQGAKLSDEERVRALSSASAICLGREELGNASDLFDLCLKLVALLPEGSAGFERPLAVAANNLACALGELPLRSEEQTAQMVKAAQIARQYWALIGTWLETQRADYVLAKSHLRAGHLPAAASCAVDCLSLCQTNNAAPLDMFFAHEITALVARALGYGAAFEAARQSALKVFDMLDTKDRTVTQGERDALLAC
jgi:hypothetical protein